MGETKIEWVATRNADGAVTPGYSWNPWIGCTPLTPYQMGFESCSYQGVYANPFPLRSRAWRSYEAGHADARAQHRVAL